MTGLQSARRTKQSSSKAIVQDSSTTGANVAIFCLLFKVSDLFTDPVIGVDLVSESTARGQVSSRSGSSQPKLTPSVFAS